MMLENNLDKVLSSLVKCVFCNFDFLENTDDIVYSKFLECYHTVCGVCQNTWTEEETKQCPECQVPVHKKNLTEPTIFKELVSTQVMESAPKFCGMHKNDQAVNWCQQCGDFVCSSCVESHKLLKHTQNHVMKPTEEYERNNVDVSYFCTVHPKERLILNCLNCQKLTCRDCQLNEHRTHKYDFISNQIGSVKNEIFEKNVYLSDRYQAVLGNRSFFLLEKDRVKLHKVETRLTSEINEAYNEVIKKLDRIKDDLLKEVNSQINQKLTVIQNKKNKLTLDSQHVNRTILFTQYVLSYSSDSAIIQHKKNLLSMIDKNLAGFNSGFMNPLSDTKINFISFAPKIIQGITNLGIIHSIQDCKGTKHHGYQIASGKFQQTQMSREELLNDLEVSEDENEENNRQSNENSNLSNVTSKCIDEFSIVWRKVVAEKENNPLPVENNNRQYMTPVHVSVPQNNTPDASISKNHEPSRQDNIADVNLNIMPGPFIEDPICFDNEKAQNKDNTDTSVTQDIPAKSPSLTVKNINLMIDQNEEKQNCATPTRRPSWHLPVSEEPSTSTSSQNKPLESPYKIQARSSAVKRYQNSSPSSRNAPTLSLPNTPTVRVNKSSHVPIACMPTPRFFPWDQRRPQIFTPLVYSTAYRKFVPKNHIHNQRSIPPNIYSVQRKTLNEPRNNMNIPRLSMPLLDTEPTQYENTNVSQQTLPEVSNDSTLRRQNNEMDLSQNPDQDLLNPVIQTNGIKDICVICGRINIDINCTKCSKIYHSSCLFFAQDLINKKTIKSCIFCESISTISKPIENLTMMTMSEKKVCLRIFIEIISHPECRKFFSIKSQSIRIKIDSIKLKFRHYGFLKGVSEFIQDIKSIFIIKSSKNITTLKALKAKVYNICRDIIIRLLPYSKDIF